MASRPESSLPPELYYDDKEAKKYTQNSRIIQIQSEMSERAIELLSLPEDPTIRSSLLVLDVGCGSGISGAALTEAGLNWFGVDISSSMLEIALENEVEGGLARCDIGHGLPFRAGCFDAVVSVSALQWLAYSDSLYACMSVGARAVLQFYPADELQLQLLLNSAMSCGFTGGLVTDYPESAKARKHFLVLDTAGTRPMPAAQDEAGGRHSTKQQQPMRKGSKAWIMRKKEQYRRKNPDSKALPSDS
uniref:Methyltransf_11 domain-containing protein n=1 Tax=Macrostomum lignano TaxID=282301 RepID=A0A1I8HQ80_9PLAT